MKCSDCKLWKTDECKLNPDAKDLFSPETFACFVPKEEQIPVQSQRTKKANFSAVGLTLVILGIVGFGFSVKAFIDGMGQDAEGLFLVLIGTIGGLISAALFLVGLLLCG